MQRINLLSGSILPTLARLAFPIMATSLIQMAYNLTDMIWIGRVSSDAVAAVGTAGMYLWLAQGLATIPRLGVQVRTAHTVGAGNWAYAVQYVRTAFHMGGFLVLIFTASCLLFHEPMIDFFQLNSAAVSANARSYLLTASIGLIFSFSAQIFTGIFTAIGNSSSVFLATSVGLIANIVLDPIFIFGIGFVPAMGVLGAALATIIAQALVCIMFLLLARREPHIFPYLNLLQKTTWNEWHSLLQIGLPVALQSMFFSSLSMIIARLISSWGDAAIAAQKVGGQIESISYMAADGFAMAVNAFVAQNFGAGQYQRIRKGYWTAIVLVLTWSTFTSCILIFFPEYLFKIFIAEANVIPMGASYLRIMGYSQIFMCLEITSAGAFQGLGRPLPSTITGIIGNIARIPLAIILSATILGLDGVWWSITISSIAKGIVVFFWFIVLLKRFSQLTEQSKF